MRFVPQETASGALLFGLLVLFLGQSATAQDLVTLRNFDPEGGRFVWTLDKAIPIDTGFIFGTNEFADRAKATALAVPDTIPDPMLVEVRVWFGYLAGDTTGLTYHIDIYDGTPLSGPLMLTARKRYPLSHIAADDDAGTDEGPTSHSFVPAMAVDSSFFVSVSFGDYDASRWGTIAIASSPPLDERVDVEWEQLSTNDWEWKNISDSWRSGSRGWNMWIEADVMYRRPATAGEYDAPPNEVLVSTYPNPFATSTTIDYTTLEAGPIRIQVFNQLGQEIARPVDSYRSMGRQRNTFEADNLPPGAYVLVLQTASQRVVRTMIVSR